MATESSNRPVALLGLDADGAVAEVSPGAVELFGVEPGLLEGRRAEDLFRRVDHEAIRAILEGSHSRVMLSSVINGRLNREIEVCLSVGVPLGSAGHALVIRPLESSCPLRESISRLEGEQRRLFESLQVGVVVHGPGSEILYWNQKALELLGMNEAQLTGRTSFDPRWKVIHRDGSDFPGSEHPVNLAIERRRPVLAVVMGVHRPERGDRVWLLVDAQPRLSGAGELEEVVVTFTDITAQQQLADEVARAQKQELVNRLSGGITHDFNNMLAVIMTVAELGQLDATSEEQRVAFADILDAAKRGSQLSRRILSLSGRRMEQRKRVAVDAHLRETATLAQRAIGEGIELELAFAAPAAVVTLDPSRFEQAVLNLIINARDAMAEGGTIRLSTRVDAEAGRERVVIEVEDTGTGIPEPALAHVFEPFFTTKSEDEGTGLGLATVKEFVTACGGSVSFETSPSGTCFRLTLPCERMAAAQIESLDPAARAAATSEAPSWRRLLLVDNDPQLRRVTADSLRRLGHEVMVAPSGEAALKVLAENEIHLLITDVAMPGMDGVSLARRARALVPELPVLFISGFVGEHLEELPPLSASSRFLAKPFTASQLHQALHALLAEQDSPTAA